ncbi:MAG: metallopeptidase family protein [Acidimicrobiia bacterium]|nr:metallopeptidase family protein [Acidimicrobiia bacterium]
MFDVPTARFEELVAEALDEIPEGLAEHMDNVAVFVEDEPLPEQVPADGDLLLGLYEGISLTNRGPMSYEGVMPDRITIYRLAICEISRSEQDVRRQVLETVVHEVGHHFGLDDEELHELGWG